MRGVTRRLVAAVAVVGAAVSLVPRASASEFAPPSAWPNNGSVRPRLDAWPNALRIHGDNRYQTALAATLVLRGSGADDSYPYGNPDPATTKGWWGLDTCPRSVIVVAGDNPADALAASSLSDPTGSSTEPYLQRSAAADPVFFPPGGFVRVDTDFAPILTTTSARQGATQLDIATRLAAQDLSRGACTTAKQAIIVGGVRAVAASVEAELVSIGYDEVFRIAGSSRYQTARLVAESLGTAAAPGSPPSTRCADASSRNGAQITFYANSVVEYRESATQCRLLNRTVVLADGVNGIDALASGWWTSFWQVPILLTDGDDVLPSSTRDALQTLEIDTIVVLGGTARISDENAADARELSGASESIRIAGDDRYATSIAMARVFGGWWASQSAADAEGSMMCVAASSGGSRTSAGIGWADALAAGPWCARLGVARAALGAPARALSPITGGSGALSAEAGNAREPAHRAVPMILVPAGAASAPTQVATPLAQVFGPNDDWCSGETASEGCSVPGFALVFGGSSLVTDAMLGSLDRLVSGGQSDLADQNAQLDDPFVTDLDMAPVFADEADDSDPRVCALRGSYQHARWWSVRGDRSTSFDLVGAGSYAADGDAEERTPGTGRPQCFGLDSDDASVTVWAVPASGRQPVSSQLSAFSLEDNDRFALSGPLVISSPTSSQGPSSSQDDSDGGTTAWTYVGSVAGVAARSEGDDSAVTAIDLVISLVRGENDDLIGPDTFTAEFTITTGEGTVRGEVVGEATLVGGVWKLRGVVTFRSGGWSFDSGRGGFSADITTGPSGLNADDSVSWQVDGVN